jgi:hypothetical protein
MESELKKVILFIADISGYTNFIKWNMHTLIHSQTIITKLMEEIINRLEIPLEISKLEGDAVFFYAIKHEDQPEWMEARKKIGDKLISLIEAFSSKVVELSESRDCECYACKGIDNLKLKIIIHSGEALFYKIGKFYELSGLDVIIIHRLLKNSVNKDEYLLITDRTVEDIELSQNIPFIKSNEEYDGIGNIKTFVYFPKSVSIEQTREIYNHNSILIKLNHKIQWVLQTWFYEIAIQLKFKKKEDYRNIPVKQNLKAGDIITGIFLLIFSPVTLPLVLLQSILKVITTHQTHKVIWCITTL